MTQRTEAKQDLLKQNFELTLIIIFIGLAFGLVGLIVQTAAVMSIVVISVGVIVGFVSYRDAFVLGPNGELAVSTPIPQKLPAPAEAVKPEPRPQAVRPESRPQPETRPQQITPRREPQELEPNHRQIEEPLPRLPKIHRLTTPEEPTFSSPIKPTKEVTQQPITAVPPITSQPNQDRLAKPRKGRMRKTVEIPGDDEEGKD